MSVLAGYDIKQRCLEDGMISPFVERTVFGGMSYGLSHAGYDIRIKTPELYRQGVSMWPGRFLLASSVERIKMPKDLICVVHDKSTWARKGLAVQNTVLEPGWEGWITLELTNHKWESFGIEDGMPIAQLLFYELSRPVQGYSGKYQNQPDEAVSAIMEGESDADE